MTPATAYTHRPTYGAVKTATAPAPKSSASYDDTLATRRARCGGWWDDAVQRASWRVWARLPCLRLLVGVLSEHGWVGGRCSVRASSDAYPRHVLNRRELLVRAAGLGAALAVPDWLWAAAIRASSRWPPRCAAGVRAGRGRLRDRPARIRQPLRRVKPLAVVQPLDAADVGAVVRWATKTGSAHRRPLGRPQLRRLLHVANGVVVDLARLKSVAVCAGCGPSAQARGSGTSTTASRRTGSPSRRDVPERRHRRTRARRRVRARLAGVGARLRQRARRPDRHGGREGDRRGCEASPRLYWACRGGGGGNFGIATRFTFRTHAVAQGSYFVATWPWAQAEEVVAAFFAWAPHQPDALGALCRLAAGPGGPTVQVFGQFLGSETALKASLASLQPPATKLTTGTATWLDSSSAGPAASATTCRAAPLRGIPRSPARRTTWRRSQPQCS